MSPRFSAVYDFAGDGRTALKFAANRYIIPVGSSVLDRVNPIFLASDTRPWRGARCAADQTNVGCDLNGDLLPQINELGPSNGIQFRQRSTATSRATSGRGRVNTPPKFSASCL